MIGRFALGLLLLGVLGAAITAAALWWPIPAMLFSAAMPFFGAMLALSRWAQGLAPD